MGEETTAVRKRRSRTWVTGVGPVRRELRPGGDDWKGCVSEFLESERLKSRQPRTISLHRENLRYLRAGLLALNVPPVPLQIEKSHLKRLVLRWQDEGKAPRSINLRRQTMRAFFGFLCSERLIPGNPSEDLPRQKEPKHLPKALSEAQVRRLLAQPDRRTFVGLRDYTMIVLMLDTGMRLGEIIGLETGDIDWERRCIRLRRTKDSEEREVYIAPACEKSLRLYARERGSNLDTQGFFVSRFDEKLSANSFQCNLRRYGRRAGFEVSPHRLRHTFAKLYITGGGDAFSLQRILGHSDLATVENYVKLWGEDVQKLHRQHSPVNRLVGDVQ